TWKVVPIVAAQNPKSAHQSSIQRQRSAREYRSPNVCRGTETLPPTGQARPDGFEALPKEIVDRVPSWRERRGRGQNPVCPTSLYSSRCNSGGLPSSIARSSSKT